jgi:hypothetical protein
MIKQPKDDSICFYIFCFTIWHNVTFRKTFVLRFQLYLILFDETRVNDSIELASVIQLVP